MPDELSLTSDLIPVTAELGEKGRRLFIKLAHSTVPVELNREEKWIMLKFAELLGNVPERT